MHQCQYCLMPCRKYIDETTRYGEKIHKHFLKVCTISWKFFLYESGLPCLVQRLAWLHVSNYRFCFCFCFLTLNDSSLKINILALNICFSTETSFKMASTHSQKCCCCCCCCFCCLFVLFVFCFVFVFCFLTQLFVKNLKISCRVVWTIRFCSDSSSTYKMYGETSDFFMSALATIAGKKFFPIGYFMLPLLILTLKA